MKDLGFKTVITTYSGSSKPGWISSIFPMFLNTYCYEYEYTFQNIAWIPLLWTVFPQIALLIKLVYLFSRVYDLLEVLPNDLQPHQIIDPPDSLNHQCSNSQLLCDQIRPYCPPSQQVTLCAMRRGLSHFEWGPDKIHSLLLIFFCSHFSK